VPFLFSSFLGVIGMRCLEPLQHVWRGHWNGPATDMALLFTGVADIEARDVSVHLQGFEQRVPFTMPADSDLTVTLSLPPSEPWPLAVLFEATPAGDRVPDWERFTPVRKRAPAVAAADGAPAPAP
jgi:hypothetical protein